MQSGIRVFDPVFFCLTKNQNRKHERNIFPFSFDLHRHECGVKSTAKANEEAAHDEAFNATKEMRRAHQRGTQNGNGVVQEKATFSGTKRKEKNVK